jgi:hypothetical protein
MAPPTSTDTLPADCMRVMGAGLWNLPGSVMQEMLGARRWFAKNHEATGVRMAFLCSGSWMIQWYEGSPEAVEAAWALAGAHPAQRNLRLLHRSRGPAFVPDPVHIASVHDGASATEVGRRIYRVEREHALGWLAEPADIWRALGAPSALGNVPGADSVARRGLVVLTSEYNECFDVLKGVADRLAARPVYQRFASGKLRSGDVGGAYIDLDSGNHVTRVQALSRAALSQRMVRLNLRDSHCIVMLVGERPHAAAALAEEVAAWVESEPMRPEVKLIGPDPESCAAAAQVLATCVPRLHVTVVRTGQAIRTRTDAMLDVLAGTPSSSPAPLDFEFN